MKKLLISFRFFLRGLVATAPRSWSGLIEVWRWARLQHSDRQKAIELGSFTSYSDVRALAHKLSRDDSLKLLHFSGAHNELAMQRASNDPQSCAVVRIDCDDGYPERVERVLNIFDEFGVTTSPHILVDGSQYSPEIFKGTVGKSYQSAKFGLHSASWCKADPIQELQREVDLFRDVFGCKPESISLHGERKRGFRALITRRKFISVWNATHAQPQIQHGFSWTCQDSRVGEKTRLQNVSHERINALLIRGALGNIVIHDSYLESTDSSTES